MLAASAMEGSRTTLDETVMPPPSTPRGVKRKTMDKEATLPVSASPVYLPQTIDMKPNIFLEPMSSSREELLYHPGQITWNENMHVVLIS